MTPTPISLSKTVLAGLSSLMFAIAPGSPARGAEEITLSYGPAETSIPIADIERFAREGKTTPTLVLYGRLLRIQDGEGLREALTTPFQASPWSVEQFLDKPTGEVILRRMGKVVNTGTGKNGASALRTAIAGAAARPGGLTLLGILQEFPDREIQIDLEFSLNVVRQTSRVLLEDTAVLEALQQKRRVEDPDRPTPSEPFNLPNPRQPGPYSWREAELLFFNPNRDRPSPFYVYIPENLGAPAPLIVISHGLGSDPKTFSYVAEHLASHGYAVAIPEHIGTSANRFQGFLEGFERPPEPSSFADRPLDITYLLDLLEEKSRSDPAWRNRLDLQNVGVMGQSFGGYTVLALAGATLNPEKLKENCSQPDERQITLNLSILLQCRALEVAPERQNFRDRRIKAAIAVNPLASLVFGESGMGEIDIPVAIVAGTNDYITPALPEQIEPFTWLRTPDKLLVLFEPGTHFSFLRENGGQVPIPPQLIGPDPEKAYPYLKALSLTFFNVHVRDRSDYRAYLSEEYLQTLGPSPFTINLVKDLNLEELRAARSANR